MQNQKFRNEDNFVTAKAPGFNYLVRDQEAGGSNPLAPTILSMSYLGRLRRPDQAIFGDNSVGGELQFCASAGRTPAKNTYRHTIPHGQVGACEAFRVGSFRHFELVRNECKPNCSFHLFRHRWQE